MKKSVCLLLVALVATVVFANVAVNIGLGYDKINTLSSLFNDQTFKVKREAFSLTTGAAYADKSGFVLFDDFSILFGDNAYVYIDEENPYVDLGWDDMTCPKGDGDEYLVFDPTFSFKNHVGIGYALPFDLPVRIVVGLDYAFSKTILVEKKSISGEKAYTYNILNSGVGLNSKVFYSFNNGLKAYADAKVDFMFKQGTEVIPEPGWGPWHNVSYDNNTLTVNYGFTAGLDYKF